MPYEAANFGDGSASGSGNVTTQVSTQFGRAETKWARGNVKTEGYKETLSIRFDYVQATADALNLLAPTIPAGARITKASMVTLVLGVTGSSAVIDVGTQGSEATNGFTITEAQLETAADTFVDLTGALSGTWDAEKVLAADTVVDIALTVEAATAGEWEVFIEYELQRPFSA